MPLPGLDARAVRICERAAEAWWGWRGAGESAVPLSVIAAFCLADGISPKALLEASDDDVVKGIGEAWAGFWLRRPDLCIRCGPLAGWLNDDPLDPGLVRAAAAVARAAVKAGIRDLLGHTRYVDLLGHAYITMRPRSAAQARGEYYTPAAVCEMIARMTLASDLRPGMSIAEPAAGTGGMLRAAAQVMRERGQDPADYWWIVNDVSPLVTAALAVNCHLWGLGHHVVIRAANTLTEPGWPASSWEEQRAAVAQRDRMLGTAALFAAAMNAGHLAEEVSARDTAAPAPAPVTAVPDIELPGAPLSTGSRARPAAPRRPAAGRREAAGRRPSRSAARKRGSSLPESTDR